MRKTVGKIIAVVLIIAVSMETFMVDSGVVRAKTQDVFPDQDVFLTEDGWYYCYENYNVIVDLGGEEYKEYEGIKICGYDGEEKELKVPEKIDGKVVWAIDTNAFWQSDIQSISLPENLIDIGVMAFNDCKKLERVTIYECEEKLNYVDKGYVSASAFSGCESLEEITLPKQIQWIGMQAFEHCYNLKEIVIPEGVERIGQMAFQHCRSLESIQFPDSLETIEYIAFIGCKSLKSVELPKNLKTVGQSIMKDCTSLERIEIPGSLKVINECAFSGCTALKEVVILSGTQEITNLSFENCASLERIVIPPTVRRIDTTAFEGCGDVTIYTTYGTYAQNYAANNEVSYVPEEHVGDVYTAQEDWQYKIIEDGVELVYYAGTASQVSIPATLDGKPVTSIGDIAFFPWDSGENTTLKELIIPEGIKNIGESAFENCCGLEELILPFSLETIGDKAFYNCKNLESIAIQKNVTKIGKETFGNCEKLTIYGVDYTYPISYARKNNISYVASRNPDYDYDDDQEDDVTVTPAITGGAVSPAEPTDQVTGTPAAEPTGQVTGTPTATPTGQVTGAPTGTPTASLTEQVTPTVKPTGQVTGTPTAIPTGQVTGTPTATPTGQITKIPTRPTVKPTVKITATPTPVKVPKVQKVSGLKVSARKKALTVSWKKLSNITGYQLQVSTRKNFKGAKTITLSKSKVKYTAKKLKAKKKYYIRIRGYKTYKSTGGKNAKAYGSWKTVSKKTK